MKVSSFLFLVAVTLVGCNRSSHEGHNGHEHHDHQAADTVVEDDLNAVLYDEVMKVHDEAMEKMDEIYRLKQRLKTKMDSTTADGKAAIQAVYNKLDSADKGMMEWMHAFQPDSLEGEAYREYMESELERVKKVREDIQDALQRAREKTQ